MPTPPPSQASRTTLPTPSPTHPVAGRPVDTDAPVFDWTPVPHASGYRVQIASSKAFEALHYDELVERGTALPLDAVLADDATLLYWRVRAEGTNDEPSEWSAPAHFAPPGAESETEEAPRRDTSPVPLHPTDEQDAPVEATAIPFAWEEVPDASGYRLQVSATEDFAERELDLTVDRTTSVTLYEGRLPEAIPLFWRIRPLFRGADPGAWSRPLTFTVAPPTKGEQDLAVEAEDPQATARARGPVERARTSRTFSLVVSLIFVVSFLTTILLIFLVS